MLHTAHCAQDGYHRVQIRTVDTDVVVLAVAFYMEIENLQELFVAFGTGKHFKYIPIHTIARKLGPLKSRALPMFHSITGCDTTSSFGGKGEKTAWEAWQACPSVTDAFIELSKKPCMISDACFKEVERFIVVMYQRTSELSSCDEARRHLLTCGRSMENIPPTTDALFHHVKRCVLQAGYCWAQTLIVCPFMPSPSQWGWNQQGDFWVPHWMSLPEAAKGCRELKRCNCKVNCVGCCTCSLASRFVLLQRRMY